MTNLLVDWCSYEAAKYAVEHWHYSKSMPTPPICKFGVWENNIFIGCILISRGAARNIGKPFGLSQNEISELTRIALSTHVSPVSQIAMKAIKKFSARNQRIRLLVSFADPEESHTGKIYQAMNWFFVGQGNKTIEYEDETGRRWHGRMISPTGYKKVYGKYRRVLMPSQCKRLECEGKYKYLYPLDRAMRRQIEPLALPYPKSIDMRAADGSNCATSAVWRFDPDPSALEND